MIASMALPNESVTLTVGQIAELNKKLAELRHSVNNNLSLIIAAAEIMRLQPESAARMQERLAEKPHKIAEIVAQFSRDLETALRITRP
jgi:hypothetical protein